MATTETTEVGRSAPTASVAAAESPRQRRGSPWPSAWTTALLLLPAVLTVVLSFEAGAFYPGTTALAGVLLAAAAIICLALTRRPFSGARLPGLIVAVALGLFAGWTLLSSHWSHAPARAILSYDRVLIYLLTFVIFASLRRTVARMRVLVYGVATGCVTVCVAALISRTLPDVISPHASSIDIGRLAYPVTYWNALGLLAGIGLILCGHLACSGREPRLARVLGAGAAPLLATTLFLTFSRGAVWATVTGVVVYLLIARPPGAVLAGLATLPPWFVSLFAVHNTRALTAHPFAPATIARGQRDAAILLACALAAAALRAALLRFDDRFERFRIGRRTTQWIVASAIVVVVIASAALLASGVVTQKLGQFQHGGVSAGGLNRLFSASSNGRADLWRVAVKTFKASPLHGTGAGTYVIDWDQQRHSALDVQNAHSLYLETLAELGVVGMALLAIALIGILVAFARLARGPRRPFYAALLAAGVTYLLAASVDWDWQLPAITLWLFAAGGLACASAWKAPAPSRLTRLRNWLRFPALAVCALAALLPAIVLGAEAHISRAVYEAHLGNCSEADAQAGLATSAVRGLTEPALVAAYCAVRDNHPKTAIAPIQRTISKDPNNWELWYDLAVVRARAGLSASSAILTAERLNPLGQSVHTLTSWLNAPTPAQLRALSALRARNLRRQLALEALPARTAQQTAELHALALETARENAHLNGGRFAHQAAFAALKPLAP